MGHGQLMPLLASVVMDAPPPVERPLTMPSPDRTVTRSISNLHRLGYSDREALRTIVRACIQASNDLSFAGLIGLTWLDQIEAEAVRRLAVLSPHHNDARGDDHGGDTGQGPAGSTAGRHRQAAG